MMMGAHRIVLDEGKVCDGNPFPLVLSPDEPRAPAGKLADFVKTNKSAIMQQVALHGAVLLRGWTGEVTAKAAPFPVCDPSEPAYRSKRAKAPPSADTFAAAVEQLGLSETDMTCSSAPRKPVAPGVYTSNEAPPQELIPFHHEMAQCPTQPAFIIFFCEVAPATGGETPILPSVWAARFLRAAHPKTAQRLAERGVRYVRIIPGHQDESSPLGRSWRSTFGCETAAEAEAALRQMEMTWEWRPDGCLRIVSKRMHALVEHEGKELFYNAIVAAIEGWADARNDATKAVVYGDNGAHLESADLDALRDVARYMRDSQVAFKWQAGDMLLLDNKLVMHSRASFTPPRRILAAVAGPPKGRVGHLAVKPSPRRPILAAAGRSSGEVTAARTPRLKLRSWDEMPTVGLGLWKVARDATASVVFEAIRAGYRHLDCACDYGNEVEVGEGIARAISEGVVTRAELWVTSKLWNTYHAAEHVEAACRKSLADLGLDYLDLYLVHFPISLRFVPFAVRYPPEWVHDPSAEVPRMELAHVPLQQTWGAMEALVRTGLCRNIGVANMTTSGLRDLLSYAHIPPAVLQVELHPFLQQTALLRFAREAGIVVTGFSPLGSSSYVELSMATPADSVLDQEIVRYLAVKHKRSAAQIVLRWAVQRGTSIVPKSSKLERLRENVALFEFELSADDMEALATLERGRRFNDPGVFCESMGVFCPIFD